MNLNELSKKAHQASKNKGFWEKDNSIEHCLCLVVTEIGEAVEADRKNRHQDVEMYKDAKINRSIVQKIKKEDPEKKAFVRYMKDTVEDELSDVVIRLCDLAGDLEIDFTKMKNPNYFRSFGRWDFAENAFALIKGLGRDEVNIHRRILFAINYVIEWSKSLRFDLEYAIAEKMAYNETREYKNGKNY